MMHEYKNEQTIGTRTTKKIGRCYKLATAQSKNNKRGKAENFIRPAIIKRKIKFLKIKVNRNMMLE